MLDSIFVVLLMLAFGWLGTILFVRAKVKNKMLVFVINHDKVIQSHLVRPEGRTVQIENGRSGHRETYIVDTDRVCSSYYPFMPILPLTQSLIPTMMFSENNPEPMDPTTVSIIPKKGMITSRLLSSAVSDNIIEEITNATDDNYGKVSKVQKLALALTAGTAVLLILVTIILFREITKVLDYVS